MKNLGLKLGVGLSTLPALAAPLLASAAIGSGLTNANASITNSLASSTLTNASDIPTIVGRTIGVVLGVLGIAFVVMVVYAGFLYLTAQGEETNVKKAKKLLTQGVIGMVIIVSAYAISNYAIAALVKVSGT